MHVFGNCLQAHHKPQKKNDVKEHSIDAICPRPAMK